MRTAILLVTISAAALSACATGPRMPADYAGQIRTQTAPDVLAACIGKAASTAPVASSAGYIVTASGTDRRYDITRDKVQTLATMLGDRGAANDALDAAAVACAAPVAPQGG